MKNTRHPRYAHHRFPAEVISHAVWLYFRFPLSLRIVEEMLAARGILVSHETVRQWALKFGQSFAKQIRRRLSAAGDKGSVATPDKAGKAGAKVAWHSSDKPLELLGERQLLIAGIPRLSLPHHVNHFDPAQYGPSAV
jgi:hypothetical protein